MVDYPFMMKMSVIFRDLDVLGHVNHVVYLTYMETARTSFFGKIMRLDDFAQLPLILAEVNCQYVAPAYLGDDIIVGLWVSRFGIKSFDLSYELVGRGKKHGERTVARAKTVLVSYDYEKGGTAPVPPLFKERVTQLQSGWVYEG
ncbi:MAG TPA: thioesterase family protein [Anaerolineae bacterium]|nr:thioesterase family protein [Anaerolineae bacterium]